MTCIFASEPASPLSGARGAPSLPGLLGPRGLPPAGADFLCGAACANVMSPLDHPAAHGTEGAAMQVTVQKLSPGLVELDVRSRPIA